MEDLAQQEWFQQFVQQHELAYACVPPPWEAIPDSHPSNIRWRMGYGESLLMVFPVWLRKYFPSEESRVAFFWKHPPPPRWLTYLVGSIFDDPGIDDTLDGEYDELWFVRSAFPDKLKALGFKGVDGYQADYEDPKWGGADRSDATNEE